MEISRNGNGNGNGIENEKLKMDNGGGLLVRNALRTYRVTPHTCGAYLI
jgi:hypothetical protein